MKKRINVLFSSPMTQIQCSVQTEQVGKKGIDCH